ILKTGIFASGYKAGDKWYPSQQRLLVCGQRTLARDVALKKNLNDKNEIDFAVVGVLHQQLIHNFMRVKK
ncbi:MAG: hypothetical protein ACOVO1_05850, partial [Chitinophagaceae bacterium]